MHSDFLKKGPSLPYGFVIWKLLLHFYAFFMSEDAPLFYLCCQGCFKWVKIGFVCRLTDPLCVW